MLQLSPPVQTIRTARGYESSLAIWDRLRELRRIAEIVGIGNRSIRKDILAAGPCPGLWRIYYAAMTEAQKDEIVSLTEFLGNKIAHGTTLRQLGMAFDAWIEEANRQYNVFLETQDSACLSNIAGTIGEHYRKRANAHVALAPAPQHRVKAKLEIKPNIEVLPGLPIDELTPDGVFSGGKRVAVFESKLSRPQYREFKHEMTLYALTLESQRKRDVDCAIVVHSDPEGRNLFTLQEPVFDSYVSEIATNLERFLSLAQISGRIERENTKSRIVQKIKPGYKTWKRFLHRPSGLPVETERLYCPSCKYREKCYREGGES